MRSTLQRVGRLAPLCGALLLAAPAPAQGPGPRAFGACGSPATRIGAVQGSGAQSPLVGQRIDVEAVVVGAFQDEPLAGFFVQEEDTDTDGDPDTSEGLFVAEPGRRGRVREGELVRVRGQVSERGGLTQLERVSRLSPCPGDAPAAAAELGFPLAEGTDLEHLEGMRVRVAQSLVVTGNYELGRFGALELASQRLLAPTQTADPGPPARRAAALNRRSRIGLDDRSARLNPRPLPYRDAAGTRRVGERVGPLRGVLDGRFGTYRIQPTAPVEFLGGNPRPDTPPRVGGRLRVASLNTLNYFATLDRGGARCGPRHVLRCRGASSPAALARQRAKLVHAIAGLDADIVALLEIENDAGAAAAELVAALDARLGAGSYAALPTGALGSDAIKPAFLYRPARVRPHGGFAVLDSERDPRFLDTKNRPSLAQTFEELSNGERLTVIANHFKSKGSPCDDIDDPDRGDGQGPCSATRSAASRALLDWIAADPTQSGDPDVLLLGDFNAYAREDAIAVLRAGGLDALLERLLGARAYSFQFDGESGSLDHAFASASLSPQVRGVAEWAINADEPAALAYDQEPASAELFQPDNPFRSADHDPLLVGLELGSAAPAAPPSGARAPAPPRRAPRAARRPARELR